MLLIMSSKACLLEQTFYAEARCRARTGAHHFGACWYVTSFIRRVRMRATRWVATGKVSPYCKWARSAGADLCYAYRTIRKELCYKW